MVFPTNISLPSKLVLLVPLVIYIWHDSFGGITGGMPADQP